MAIRILHTADWHFGKTLEGRERISEQKQFVEELGAICDEEKIDLVLVAGDVFQTVNPSAQAEELFYSALSLLASGGTRGVVVIAGNHDHPERIKAAQKVADQLGITLLGYPKDVVYPLQIGDGRIEWLDGGTGWLELSIPGCEEHAVIAAVPYPSEARLNEVMSETLQDDEFQSRYQARIAELFEQLATHFRVDTVNIVMSHLYVGGSIESDSEVQIQIGGAYAVDKSVFPKNAQYVALGHLHRPQAVHGADFPIRYAGSPLAYSFSEAGQQKSVVVVDVKPGAPAAWKEVPLTCGKPLVKWNATEGIEQVWHWVEEGRDANAWIDLSVHVQTGLQLDEIRRLRNMHEGFIHIRPILPDSFASGKVREDEDYSTLSVADLFKLFFEERFGVVPDDELVELFMEMATNLEAEDDLKALSDQSEELERDQ